VRAPELPLWRLRRQTRVNEILQRKWSTSGVQCGSALDFLAFGRNRKKEVVDPGCLEGSSRILYFKLMRMVKFRIICILKAVYYTKRSYFWELCRRVVANRSRRLPLNARINDLCLPTILVSIQSRNFRTEIIIILNSVAVKIQKYITIPTPMCTSRAGCSF